MVLLELRRVGTAERLHHVRRRAAAFIRQVIDERLMDQNGLVMSGAEWGRVGQSGAEWGRAGQSGAERGRAGQSGAEWGRAGQSGATWDCAK